MILAPEVYWSSWCVALIVSCGLVWVSRPKADATSNQPAFKVLQTHFLVAWALCVCADWVQGPWGYALYQAYGYSRSDIGNCFVAGFLSAMVLGTFIAGAADGLGRKRCALLYCALYIASCLMQHINNYWILVLGRMLAGVATSILYTVFESWLVYEHNMRHSLPRGLLSYSFQVMYLVNNLMGSGSTWLSQGFADFMPLRSLCWPHCDKAVFPVFVGGYTLPFDMAIVALLIGGVYIAVTWEENYGARAQAPLEVIGNFGRGVVLVCTDPVMFLCGLVVVLFESTLYIFIFNWTPLLQEAGVDVPFGVAFSTFMLCCMCGSCTPTFTAHFSSIAVLSTTILLATAALLVPAFVKGTDQSAYLEHWWSCMVFEFAAGVYFPAMSTLKSEIVPESQRTTVYNIFRAPFNLITSAVLLRAGGVQLSFQISVIMLLVAVAALTVMSLLRSKDNAASSVLLRHVKA